MARNLDEPGANFNQLLELSIKLQNARTFAGSIALADETYNWQQGDWTDPDDESVGNIKILEDFVITDEMRRKPNAAGGRIYGGYAQQIADGGRVGYKDGRTVGNIVDVRNIPYYAAEGLEGLVNSVETLSKLPFAAGKLGSDLLRKKNYKEMFREAGENITPGSWSENVGLTSLVEGMAEKRSPEAKAVGNVLGLGTEIAVPTGGAFKAGQILLSKASKAMGKVKDGKTIEKLVDQKLTDAGQSRRDFNVMVGTSGLMVALTKIGLGGLFKAASKTLKPVVKKAEDDFTVKLRTTFQNSDVDYGTSGLAHFDISALTPKVKKVLYGLMKNRAATKPAKTGKDYYMIDPGDAKSVIKELQDAGFKGRITGIVDESGDVLKQAEKAGHKKFVETYKKQSMKQNVKDHQRYNEYVVYENDPGFMNWNKATKGKLDKPFISTIDEVVEMVEPIAAKAKGGRIYGKYAQQLASGGRVGYQGGDIVPKAKPFTADMFKDKADLYLQGIFAGPNKDLFLPKIRSVLEQAVNEGSITQEEGMKFINDRILFYKNFAEENPKGTLPRWEKNEGGRVGLFTGSGDYAKKYLKYGDKATQDKFNKLVNELRINMSFESAISEALREIREGSN